MSYIKCPICGKSVEVDETDDLRRFACCDRVVEAEGLTYDEFVEAVCNLFAYPKTTSLKIREGKPETKPFSKALRFLLLWWIVYAVLTCLWVGLEYVFDGTVKAETSDTIMCTICTAITCSYIDLLIDTFGKS